MNLSKAGVGECGAALVATPDGGGVGIDGVGGKIENRSVAAGAEEHRGAGV